MTLCLRAPCMAPPPTRVPPHLALHGNQVWASISTLFLFYYLYGLVWIVYPISGLSDMANIAGRIYPSPQASRGRGVRGHCRPHLLAKRGTARWQVARRSLNQG